MRFLVFLCALLVAEAAKLQGYPPPVQGHADVSLKTLSLSDVSEQSELTLRVDSDEETFASDLGPLSIPSDQSVLLTNQLSAVDISVQPSLDTSNQHSVPGHPTDGPAHSSFDASKQQLAPGFSVHGSTQNSFDTSIRHSVHGHSADAPIQPSLSGFSADGSAQLPINTPIFEDDLQGVGLSPRDPAGHESLQPSELDGSTRSCPDGQILHVDGRCVTPEVTRNMFVYSAPEVEPKIITAPKDLPLPKVEHNIVFIHTEELNAGLEPIIVPPPQRKHIIYVLNEESGQQGPRLIEVTAPPPRNPEVYFVNYADGQTPTLPDGIDFEEALKSAIHSEGTLIGGQFADSSEHDGDDGAGGVVADFSVTTAEEALGSSVPVVADHQNKGFPAGSGNDVGIHHQHGINTEVTSAGAVAVQGPSVFPAGSGNDVGIHHQHGINTEVTSAGSGAVQGPSAFPAGSGNDVGIHHQHGINTEVTSAGAGVVQGPSAFPAGFGNDVGIHHQRGINTGVTSAGAVAVQGPSVFPAGSGNDVDIHHQHGINTEVTSPGSGTVQGPSVFPAGSGNDVGIHHQHSINTEVTSAGAVAVQGPSAFPAGSGNNLGIHLQQSINQGITSAGADAVQGPSAYPAGSGNNAGIHLQQGINPGVTSAGADAVQSPSAFPAGSGNDFGIHVQHGINPGVTSAAQAPSVPAVGAEPQGLYTTP
ncbi:uncharacterized protein LOC135203867 [Macrobrachium nipponense]|uniref:uncharacterized protein LOC135203867 n=1 Tax=Macrobrachium nipponense TaxID=159736 RepID=UPI0030C7E1D1